MQNDRRELHPLRMQLFQEGFCEMETGRGSRDGAEHSGIHGLIAFLVAGCRVALDVRRKRRQSDTLDDLEEISLVVEPYCPSARGRIVDHLAPQLAVVEEDLVSDADLSRRVDNNVPDVLFRVQLAEEKHLDLGVRFFLLPVQPGLEDLCFVDDDTVPFLKVVHDVEKLLIVHRLSGPVQHEEARMVPRRRRMLCDEVTRERVSEIR